MRRFIDIGANLTDSMYAGIYNNTLKHPNDLEYVLQRSWKAGLEKIIITGGSLSESQKALNLARTNDRLFCTVGCHPTRCTEFEEAESPSVYLESLKNVISEGKNKVVAIGECGLDYDRINFCPKEIQKKYFNLQLTITDHFNLPLFLHCRNAANDLYEILKAFNLKGVIHSFDGTLNEANKFIELGYFIGLNGCSLKTAENLEVVKNLPVEKLLIETDCPWCEIRPSHASYKYISKEHLSIMSVKKEKWSSECLVKSRNEPCNITCILDVIASVKNVNSNELCEILFNNTNKLFF
ncbi:hypothetical protein WA026_016307 [Henosepilachna vigintioctopunctata]|uniref:Deoxyribonuclease TATDN1 n=1 Tax=Henosepilachna vigintioctopunctata TaxID=420089 RepID=A0AAW1UN44_9CUCU